jgi:transcriptional regulator with XRE-family HTH domain
MPKLDPSVGIAILVARKAEGLSQAKLARACGVTVKHIFAIERGSDLSLALFLTIVRELPVLQAPDVAAALLRTANTTRELDFIAR